MKDVHQGLLDEFADRLWLEEGLARNTLESYRRDLSQFTDWLEKRGGEVTAVPAPTLKAISLTKTPIANHAA